MLGGLIAGIIFFSFLGFLIQKIKGMNLLVKNIILKGENHDNTIFGITLGKTTFKEVINKSIFKNCSFQQEILVEYKNPPWAVFLSKNCIAQFENIMDVYFNGVALEFDKSKISRFFKKSIYLYIQVEKN